MIFQPSDSSLFGWKIAQGMGQSDGEDGYALAYFSFECFCFSPSEEDIARSFQRTSTERFNEGIAELFVREIISGCLTVYC